MTLLVITGLFVTSFLRLVAADPGFFTDRAVAVEIAPVASRYPDTKERADLYDRILEGVRTLSGVESAAWQGIGVPDRVALSQLFGKR